MPFYAVSVGHRPGIYLTWETCKPQVNEFPGGYCEKFATRDAAAAWLRERNVQFDDDAAVAPVQRGPAVFPLRNALISVPAGGDGACFYTSLRIQYAALYAHAGSRWSTQDLRRTAAQYIQRYADDFSFFYPWLAEGELSVAQVRQGGPRRPRHYAEAQ